MTTAPTRATPLRALSARTLAAWALAPGLALLLTACGHKGADESNGGTTTANQIPENQGIGGANDGAPGAMTSPGAIAGGKAEATSHPGNAGEGDPAGAQNYPATGQP